jgi:Flp pilus assembly protein TadD
MLKNVTIAGVALAAALLAGSTASAQSTMIRGKVIDKDGKPVAGAAIVIEFKGGVNRKFQTKSDKGGQFVQLLTESGEYQVTASADKIGSQSAPVRVKLGAAAEVTITLAPGGGGADPKAAAVRKTFEEAVAASRAGDHDGAIAKFNEAAAGIPNCADCYYNVGISYLQKKDEKQAEENFKKALELKPDYSEAAAALATLYNNQKRFDEAAAMSAKASAGGAGGGGADALYNQGIILWNQGKIPDAKGKFEEALKADPNHADSHYQLGMALINEGKLPEAVGMFEKYLSIAPNGQFAAQAKAMVAQLKK